MTMFYLIGIDDTDNESTPCTGQLGWELGLRLESLGDCRLLSVTRHLLLQNKALPGCGENAAACLLIESTPEKHRDLELASRQYLLRNSARGADPGFVLAPWNLITPAISAWGRLAKQELLNRQDAMQLVRSAGIAAAGLIGSGKGVIGALAAVGLFHTGSDGRYYWLPGLRELNGIYSVDELMTACPFDRLENRYGRRPIPRERIFIDGWARPILRDGKALLLLEASEKGKPYDWETLSREEVEVLCS